MPHRLGVRLIAAVGLALLPLAILAYVQASRVQSEAQARSEAALFGETLMAATPLVERINNARGIVAALAAAVPALTDDPDACSALMGRTRAGDPTISFVAYVGADGISRCNSTGETRDFSDSPITQDLLLARKPSIGTNRNPMISGESILLAAHPVLGPEGQPLGFVAVSIPHRMLDDNDPIGTETDGHVAPLSLITFDATGELLSARLGLDSAPDRLPRGRPLAIFASSGAIAFSGETMGGERRTFAVVPMIEGQLFRSGLMAARGGDWLHGRRPAALGLSGGDVVCQPSGGLAGGGIPGASAHPVAAPLDHRLCRRQPRGGTAGPGRRAAGIAACRRILRTAGRVGAA
ncbi:MAG: PDC sensor domain-containing protein [Rhodobacter sp.]|nr:PDC sensor domain-containing protein [Rhodobacter sp.]